MYKAQAPVIQRVDNAVSERLNSAVGVGNNSNNTYPRHCSLDSDLSGGQSYPFIEQFRLVGEWYCEGREFCTRTKNNTEHKKQIRTRTRSSGKLQFSTHRCNTKASTRLMRIILTLNLIANKDY